MPSASAISVSVIPAKSSSRYQSALLRASRDTSSAKTIPTCPSPTCAASSANPARPAALAPDTPRSSSITRTPARGQPSSTARPTRSYWRAVDSRLRDSWAMVDWRTYTTAARRSCAALTLDSLIADHPAAHRGGSLGDHVGKQRDRHAGRIGGQAVDRLCRRRCQDRLGARGRARVWYQTELGRLHGSPPCTVTSLQPVPAARRSARRHAVDPPATPGSRPGRRHRRWTAGRPSTRQEPATCCRRAAPAATPPSRAVASHPTPATTGHAADDELA